MMGNGLDEEVVEPALILPLERRLVEFDQDVYLRPAHRSTGLSSGRDQNVLAQSRVAGINRPREVPAPADTWPFTGHPPRHTSLSARAASSGAGFFKAAISARI
jgi:hypothetical protein